VKHASGNHAPAAGGAGNLTLTSSLQEDPMEQRNRCRLDAFRRVQQFLDEHATDLTSCKETVMVKASLPCIFGHRSSKTASVSRLNYIFRATQKDS